MAGLGASPTLLASIATTFLPVRMCSLTSAVVAALKLLPLPIAWLFRNILKSLSAVTAHIAEVTSRPGPTTNSRRKNRFPTGTLALGSPSGYQIQCASANSMRSADSRRREAS